VGQGLGRRIVRLDSQYRRYGTGECQPCRIIQAPTTCATADTSDRVISILIACDRSSRCSADEPCQLGRLSLIVDTLVVVMDLAWPQWGSGPGRTSASGSASRSRTSAGRWA